jgi:hypothetical protein
MRISLYLALGCALAGACDKESPASSSGSGGNPKPTGVGPVAEQQPRTIEIFVDDKSVAKVGADQIAKWPRLDTLLPEEDRRLGTWQMLYLKSPTGAPVSEVTRPSTTYPELVPAVFPGDDGTPAFGMFDPVELAKHGKPGLRKDAINEIRIKTSGGDRGGDHVGNVGGNADPSKLVIAIKTPQGNRDFTGAQLLALPREPMPGNEDTKGWRLSKVLEAAGIKKFERLVLTDAAGMTLALGKHDFDDKTTIPFIKLNKQGALRFRVLKQQNGGWTPTGDLRALTTIQVTK